ncbi:hypothetical protein SK128_026042 [Halocaridina rubra]|uniref:Uncharacterized protein n=1 Tax=Halocaridina rubra TaxID=373956 RepID=A0AAN8X1W5_HALRR
MPQGKGRGAFEGVVYINSTVNDFETVYVTNAKTLMLSSGLCTSVNLYHVKSALYTNTTNKEVPASPCKAKPGLHLYNTTIDNVPSGFHTYSMENSRLLGTLIEHPQLQVKVSNSYINVLNIETPKGVNCDIRIQRTTINLMTGVVLNENSGIVLTASEVKNVSLKSIRVYDTSHLSIARSSFLQGEANILLHNMANITLENVTGTLKIRYGHLRSGSDVTGMEKKWLVVLCPLLILQLNSVYH